MSPSLATRISPSAALCAVAENNTPRLGSSEHLTSCQLDIRACSCGTSMFGGGQNCQTHQCKLSGFEYII